MSKLRRNFILLINIAALSLIPFALTACDDDEDNNSTDSVDMSDLSDTSDDIPDGMEEVSDMVDQVEDETASLRVIHLSGDAPAVDIALDSAVAIEDLAFASSTPYVELTAQSYDVSVMVADSMTSVLELAGVMIEADTQYSVAAYGAASDLAVTIIVDDPSGIAASDVRLRVAHLAHNVGQVDIWVIGEDGASPLLTDVDYQAVADAIDVPAMAYTLGVDIDDDANPDLIYEVPALPSGQLVNVFATEDADAAVVLVAQFADGTTATIEASEVEETADIRVLHLSPDAPAVDVYVNGEVAVSSLDFGSITDYITVPAGAHDFAITAAGGNLSDAVWSASGVEIAAMSSITITAFGGLADLQVGLVASQDVELADEMISLRPIHMANGVGQVDIWNLSVVGEPAIIAENVDFGVVASSLELPVAAYTIGFDVDEDATPDYIFDIPELAAGTVVDVFANITPKADFELLAVAETGIVTSFSIADAMLSVIHLSPDAPAVDIFVDEMASGISGLEFGQTSGQVALAPGSYSFQVAPTGGTVEQAVLSAEGVELSSGLVGSAVAYNTLDAIELMVLVSDRFGVEEGKIRVRPVHLAAAVGQVDVWEVSDPQNPIALYTDVDFEAVGTYAELDVSTYTLGIDTDNDGNPELTFDIPELPEGSVVDLLAVNNAEGVVTLEAHFADGSLVSIAAN